MEFTFLNTGGSVAFYRSDAEQAEWTQEELSLLCTFPVDRKKIIERGMTVLFQDPASGDWQAYEIRNCTMFPGESYQQFTAESIAISELMDCHISNDIELTNVTAGEAVSRVIGGTGWSIGTNSAGGTSLGDIGRGSVWEAISTIKNNWNVYILPRVTVNANGIAGRYLDILPPDGVWRGLRLSIDKNCSDPCVTYDDSELYTALYGYGATYIEGDDPETQVTKETTFESVSWGRTGDHPAKPAGQKFIEWPEKTALYGRRGRPRYGYFQNTAIKDPDVLIAKTWATLKKCSDPKISVTGTVTDLRRLGYKDTPLRLHDMAIIDLNPVGIQMYRQVIKLTVDLLDATKNRPTIGDYLPNIIYINRETEDFVTGGSKGVATRDAGGSNGGSGGGGGGRTRSAKKQGQFETDILQNERNIILEARQVNENRDVIKAAGMKIDPITGVIIYAEDVENGIGSNFRVTNNMITAEVAQRVSDVSSLSSRIVQTANAITLETTNRMAADSQLSGRITVASNKISLVVRETSEGYEVNSASIVAGINSDHGSYIKIQADTINLTGYVTASQLAATNASIDNLKSGVTTAAKLSATTLQANSSFNCYGHNLSLIQKTLDGTTYHFLGYYG